MKSEIGTIVHALRFGRIKANDRMRFQRRLSFLEADKIGIADYIDGTDQECWRGYYDDGYSPKSALGEDLSYA